MVVELQRMNKILKLDADNFYAVCQTGVFTGQLQAEARKAGVMYAGDPSSAESCQIGGNVANNAGGNRAVRYGTTRDQIYALKVVTPTGDIVDVGARLKKCSTGLCLEQLFAGSEGTLGIITEVTVKLRPLPPYSFNMVCVFNTDKEAFALPNKILKAGIDPTSIEYMGNSAIDMTCKYLDNMDMPHVKEGCCYVIVTVESFDQDESDRKMEKLCDLAEANGSIDEFEADQRIWTLRKQFAEAARDIDRMFQTEDFVVPLDKIAQAIDELSAEAQQYPFRVFTLAHAGDGNLHFAILKGELSDEEWEQALDAFHEKAYRYIYALGGKLSGEHGIGAKKVKQLARLADPGELYMMETIKKALDPLDILNPGKVLEVY